MFSQWKSQVLIESQVNYILKQIVEYPIMILMSEIL